MGSGRARERKSKSHHQVAYSAKYPVIGCSKYRHQVVVNGVAERLKQIILQTASEWPAEVLELEVMPAQVQRLGEVDPPVGIQRWVRPRQGRSSHWWRQAFGWLRSRSPTL